jgi:hypothetical protein
MHQYRSIWFLLVMFASPATTAGDVYKWVDEQGNIHFGDKPPDEGIVEGIEIDYTKGRAEPGPETNQNIESQQEPNPEPREIKPPQKKTMKSEFQCNPRNREICFNSDDDLICKMRYSLSCSELYFWKTDVYEKCQRGIVGCDRPDKVLSSRPKSMLTRDIDKPFPNTRNISPEDITCLKKHGFYCHELNDENTCVSNYNMSCDELKNWRGNAIHICKNNRGTDCDDLNFILKSRPHSLEEIRFIGSCRSESGIGYTYQQCNSADKAYELVGLDSNDKYTPNNSDKLQSLIDRFPGE